MVVVINRKRKLNISGQKIANSVYFNVTCMKRDYNLIIKIGDEIIKPTRNYMDTTIEGRDFMVWVVIYNGLCFEFNHYGDYFKLFIAKNNANSNPKDYECKNFSVEFK